MSNLIIWLNEEINDGEKIRIIERFISYISIADDNDYIRYMWMPVKDDNDVRDITSPSNDIVLIVVCS